MYFPYLYNKQAENLALRTLSDKSLLSKTIPIVETIFDDKNIDWSSKSSINTFIDKKFKSLIGDFSKNKNKFIFVLNESFNNSGITFDDLHKILSLYAKNTNIDDICYWGVSSIEFTNLKNSLINKKCVVFYENNLDIITSDDVNIEYHILLDEKQTVDFISLNLKNKVIISDAFKKKNTNREYASSSLFSNNIFSYTKIEGFSGFGDYTILEKNPSQSDGGNMNTITVAAHITLSKDDKLYINHYICIPEDIPNNSQRITNVIEQIKKDKSIFYASNGLEELTNIPNSTSLVKIKELTISHHIENINHLIS